MNKPSKDIEEQLHTLTIQLCDILINWEHSVNLSEMDKFHIATNALGNTLVKLSLLYKLPYEIPDLENKLVELMKSKIKFYKLEIKETRKLNEDNKQI